MNPEKLLSRHPLKNGLSLEFWDLSRPLLGDRWQVVVEARVAIPVSGETLPAELGPQLSQVISALGKELVFAQQEVRNFVDTGEMAGLLKQIEEQLLASLKAYLGHPEFAARLIRKKLADQQRERG
ncbi:MAG: hypothetical protein AB1424_18190 [Thermodesulfobacteriota bacterium]